MRAALGCSDRGHTAISQLKPGDFDWDALFAGGVRWFHTGGIFAALSETTPQVAREAMEAAKRHGTIVSYDLNYRASLWKGIGGAEKAREVNRELVSLVDVSSATKRTSAPPSASMSKASTSMTPRCRPMRSNR